MARTAMIVKAERKPKFMTRKKNRCKVCGRARGYLRKFQLCRICFRQLSLGGYIPGITKASWQESSRMPMTDPIAAMSTRIRNGIQSHHDRVQAPASNLTG